MPMPLLSEEDRTEVLRIFGDLKTKYGALDAAIAAGKPTGEIKAAIEKIDGGITAMQTKYQELAARADAIEEKQRQLPARIEPPKSIGQQVIEDAGFLAFIRSQSRGSYTVAVKGPLLGKKDISGLSALWPEMMSVVAAPAYPPIGVRTLIPQGRTTSGAVEYIRETSFTNLAAPVAETAPKPQSEKVFTPITQPVQVIATYFKVSRQTWDDLPFVSAQIENNGVYGVQKAEDNQLLNGTGVSPQLQGLMPVAGAAPAPVAPSPNLVDAIGAAVFDLAAKGYLVDGTVVNPADWGQVAMLKNSQGNYLFANPVDYSPITRVWGTRLVQTSSMTAGNFLVGGFQGHALLLDREDLNVQIATQNEDDFVKNMVTILVEERVVLCVMMPAAFEKGVTPAAP